MSGRTFISQPEQIFKSEAYDDTVAYGVGLETGSLNLQDDLNALRSQVKRLIWTGGSGSWYDAVTSSIAGNTQIRGVNLLNDSLYSLEQHRLIFRAQLIDTNVNVIPGQNYVILSVSGTTAPTSPVAVGSTSVLTGTIVANVTGAIGVWSNEIVSGSSKITPKNLVIVRDASTTDPIADLGNDVFGLLQVSSTTVDGDSLNDTTKRAQISFVTEISGVLVPTTPSAIGGKTINYEYPKRVELVNLPEDAFLSDHVFLDIPVGSLTLTGYALLTDVTLQRAINNQGSTPVVLGTNVFINNNGFSWSFVDGPNGRVLLQVSNASFSATSNNISLVSSGNMSFMDSGSFQSTWAGQPILFSSGTSDWNNFMSYFGPSATLLNSLVALSASISSSASSHRIYRAGVTQKITAGTNVTFGSNIDAQLGSYAGKNFNTDVDTFLNGVLLWPGITNDVYPGTSAATGDLKFNATLRSGSTITLVVR
jgi:hypothetical protein